MRKRFWRLLAPGLLICAAATQSGLAAPPPRTPVPDTHLDQRVDMAQPHGLLGDLLKELSTQTGVQHQAKPPHSGNALVVFNARLSLRALHKALARTMLLSWQRKSSSYIFSESGRDRALRRDEWLRAEEEGRQAILRRIQHRAALSQMQQSDLEKQAAAGDEFAVLEMRDRKHHGGGSSLVRQFVLSLPDGMLQKALMGGVADLKYSDMPPGLQRQFDAIVLSRRKRVRKAGGPVGLDGAQEHGAIRLHLAGTWSRPELQLGARFDQTGGIVASLTSTSLAPDPADRRLAMKWSPEPRHPEFRKTILIRDTGRPAKQFFEGGQRPPGALPLQPLLEQLSRQISLPILAECDFKPGKPEWLRDQWWLVETIQDEPLSRALDLLCSDFEFKWELRDGAILMRPKPGTRAGGRNFRPNVPSPPHPIPPLPAYPSEVASYFGK